MKKSILLYALIVTMSYSYSQTNIYHPFPDSNAHWNFYFDRYCQFGTEIEYYSYYISGDTIINNEIYHKILIPYVDIEDLYSCPQVHYSGYKGAIRQDIPNKKVYFIPPLSSTENLLYDFNMEIGDTVPGFITSYYEDIVISIDSVLVGDDYRKRWLTNSDYDIYYIEGIGSTYGLFEYSPGGMFDAPYYYLDCFMQNEQTIYPDPDLPCQLITSVNNNEDLKDLLNVYPNPAQDFLHIENASGYHVKIFSITGLLISESEIKEDHFELKLNDVPEGMYFLRFEKDLEIQAKKIIVQR